MPKTAFSQRFQRELDVEQLLSLYGYNLKLDPDIKNISQELRDEIYDDLICPQCGANGGVIITHSKSKKTNRLIRQPHFRFGRNQNNGHSELCDYYELKNNNFQKEKLIDFSKDKTYETRIVRELVVKGIEQKIISQGVICEMRRYFFEIKVASHFIMDVSIEALEWTFMLRNFARSYNDKNIISFQPIYAELPNFNWIDAVRNQFVQENINLIKVAQSCPFEDDEKTREKAKKLIKNTQNTIVFDVTKLQNQYEKTIILAKFITTNLKILNKKQRLAFRSEIVLALAALLLYIADWNIDFAISKLVDIVLAPAPTDMNAGNVIGLNPFYDFEAWTIIMNARDVAKYSVNGFDFQTQIKLIKERLENQYKEWKLFSC